MSYFNLPFGLYSHAFFQFTSVFVVLALLAATIQCTSTTNGDNDTSSLLSTSSFIMFADMKSKFSRSLENFIKSLQPYLLDSNRQKWALKLSSGTVHIPFTHAGKKTNVNIYFFLMGKRRGGKGGKKYFDNSQPCQRAPSHKSLYLVQHCNIDDHSVVLVGGGWERWESNG